jgi:DtxR family Mn-dependent transcriptional regulator
MVTAHQREEILEALWELREEGRPLREGLLPEVNGLSARTIVEELLAEGLVEKRAEEIVLTREGEEAAASVIRRKRLAEVLLSEVLEVEHPHMEASACEMEHILSAPVTERICAFLGHPPFCPHGRPIPRGPCCSRLTDTVKPLVTSLAEFDVGRPARIVFIVPLRRERLDRLSSLGVIPGQTIRIHQKHPSFVIQVGETELALDTEIVKDIYVKAL